MATGNHETAKAKPQDVYEPPQHVKKAMREASIVGGVVGGIIGGLIVAFISCQCSRRD